MAESVIEILIKARDQTKGTLKEINDEITKIGKNPGFDDFGDDVDDATDSVDDLDEGAKSAGKSLGALSLISFAALAATITKAVGAFLDFNQAIAEVSTLVDSAEVSNEQLSSTVLELSDRFGAGAEDVAAALYQTISSGAEAGAEANAILEQALQAAVGGVTDTETAVDTLTTILNAYNLEADDAGAVSDSLFTAVRGGKTTFDELGRSLFQVVPIAASVGVGFQDVNAALAAITAGGAPTAQATTQLRGAIQGILRPTAELTELFNDYGGAQALLAQDNGLQRAFQILQEETQGNVGELQKLVGSVEGVQAVLALTGDNTERFNQQLQAQADSAGAAEEAFEKVNQEISRRFTTAITRAENGFLKLTAALEPALDIVVDLINGFADFVGGLADATAVTDFFDSLGPTIDEVGRVAGIVVDTISDLIGAIFGAADNTLIWEGVLNGLKVVLQGVAIGIAALVDGINAVTAVADIASSSILTIVASVRSLFGATDAELAGLRQQAQDLAESGFQAFEAFAAGDTALKRTVDSLAGVTDAVEDTYVSSRTLFDQLGKDAEEDLKKVEEAAEEAALVAKFSLTDLAKITKDETSASIAALDDALEQNLISFEEYYNQRAALQREAIDAEIAVQQAVADQDPTPKNLEKIATAQANLIILNRQRAQIGVEAAQDLAEAEAGLATELDEVILRLAEVQGGGVIPLELQTQQIEQQYADLLTRLEAQGDVRGAAIVQSLIDAETLQAELGIVETQFDQTLGNLETRTQVLNEQAQAGIISSADAINQQTRLREEALPILQAQAEELRVIAERTKDPEALAAYETALGKINDLTEATDQWGIAWEDVVAGGLTQAFGAIIDGTKTAEEAFRDFIRQSLLEIAKLIAQQIILNALRNAGLGVATGGLITPQGVAFAEGGKVTGPGGPTGDKIPARLSAGEFVMRAAAVKKYGVGIMAAINRGLLDLPKVRMPSASIPIGRRRFAEGGFVTDSGAQRPEATAEQATGSNLRLVNVVDTDQTANYLESSDGEQMVVNIIRRNGSSIKQLLR